MTQLGGTVLATDSVVLYSTTKFSWLLTNVRDPWPMTHEKEIRPLAGRSVSAQELNNKMRMARMKPVLRYAQMPRRKNGPDQQGLRRPNRLPTKTILRRWRGTHHR